MDVVYLCRPGNNEELRYSLRSLTNVPHDHVWIFGGMPTWTQHVRYFGVNPGLTKYRNTTLALQYALDRGDVSDPFILMNDDFYVMRPGPTIPTLNRGKVRTVLHDYEQRGLAVEPYVRGMRATLDRLEHHGYSDPLSFELHVPLVVHKAAMREAIAICEGLPVIHKRTAYGAVAGLRGRPIRDVKITRPGQPTPTGRFLSTMDATFDTVRPLLEQTFPTPSIHERS